MSRFAKKKRKKLSTTKKILWLCLLNGILWVWCSYALAFIGMLSENYAGASIAESLSSAAITEIIGVVLTYCLKSLFENLSKHNNWPDRPGQTEEETEDLSA